MQRNIVRTLAILALTGAIAGCSGTAGGSASPMDATATASPAPQATASLATATPEPSAAPAASAVIKPRPSVDIDPEELDAYLVSSITFLDLADEDLAVVVTYTDPDSGDALPFGTYRLDGMDQVTNDAPPGTYRLEFHQPSTATSGPSCTFEMAENQGYVFAALGDAIAISSTGTPPGNIGDLFVATSSLCQG